MIESTFQQLTLLTQVMSAEAQRAVELGLDEESLALFDLLRKPDLAKVEINTLKQVAEGLLITLKARLAEIWDCQATESNRDAVRLVIHDSLYADTTGHFRRTPTTSRKCIRVRRRSSSMCGVLTRPCVRRSIRRIDGCILGDEAVAG